MNEKVRGGSGALPDIVLINSLEPSYIVMSVRDHVNREGGDGSEEQREGEDEERKDERTHDGGWDWR